MNAIEAKFIRKEYFSKFEAESVVALNNISVDIKGNEFFTLLGPSGCGKTTFLRIIAGFEKITSGELSLFGENIGLLPPEKRSINTVFQHYALFPHMSVQENIAFGLARKGIKAAEIKNTVSRMLALVKMSDYADRRPEQLSGGEQQRVALARALAPHPKVLLLDEPLSALDLKLRQAMRLELKRLQRETGITFVFVTHDQEEALAMSDRIAVMSKGEVQQIATPGEIYEQPANRFVADFVGDSNFFEGVLERSLGKNNFYRVSDNLSLIAEVNANSATDKKVLLFLRPEKITLSNQANEDSIQGVVTEIVYLGDMTDCYVMIDSKIAIVVRMTNRDDGTSLTAVGETVFLQISPQAVRILPIK